jgi:hypothetical protein
VVAVDEIRFPKPFHGVNEFDSQFDGQEAEALIAAFPDAGREPAAKHGRHGRLDEEHGDALAAAAGDEIA